MLEGIGEAEYCRNGDGAEQIPSNPTDRQHELIDCRTHGSNGTCKNRHVAERDQVVGGLPHDPPQREVDDDKHQGPEDQRCNEFSNEHGSALTNDRSEVVVDSPSKKWPEV